MTGFWSPLTCTLGFFWIFMIKDPDRFVDFFHTGKIRIWKSKMEIFCDAVIYLLPKDSRTQHANDIPNKMILFKFVYLIFVEYTKHSLIHSFSEHLIPLVRVVGTRAPTCRSIHSLIFLILNILPVIMGISSGFSCFLPLARNMPYECV